MTSSSRISGGGLKKCMPTTRVGSAAAGAIEVIGIDDVFEASTARGAISESVPNSSRLISSDSGAASMTSSQSARSSSAAAPSSRSRAAAASSALQRPRSAPRSRCCGMRSSARSTAAASASKSSVRAPDSAPSCAMPDPIVPAPTTPMTFGAPLMRANANAKPTVARARRLARRWTRSR